MTELFCRYSKCGKQITSDKLWYGLENLAVYCFNDTCPENHVREIWEELELTMISRNDAQILLEQGRIKQNLEGIL